MTQHQRNVSRVPSLLRNNTSRRRVVSLSPPRFAPPTPPRHGTNRFTSPCVSRPSASRLAPALLFAAEVDRAGFEFFEKKIRPVLVEQCFECHSKGAKKVGGGLLLDTKAGLAGRR